jgi:hypothetical protein
MKTRPILQERCLRCWRIGICLLVVGLVLYNPFVALSGSSGCLSYERLACNRATVGSAELQDFSPAPNPNFQPPDVDAGVPQIEPAVILQVQEPAVDQEEMIPAEPELLAGVWFRPPPTPQLF